MNHAMTRVAGKAVLGAGVVLGLVAAPHGTAHTDTVVGYDAYTAEVGVVSEDESGWPHG